MIAHEPTDARSVVPLETHLQAIAALGNQHRRDVEALQDTAREYQLERTELQRELDTARYERNSAETDAAIALQMTAEARVLIAALVHCTEWNELTAAWEPHYDQLYEFSEAVSKARAYLDGK